MKCEEKIYIYFSENIFFTASSTSRSYCKMNKSIFKKYLHIEQAFINQNLKIARENIQILNMKLFIQNLTKV